MKKLALTLRYTASALVALVALVFTVLEGTLLITLDFTLYEDRLLSLLQLILRLLLASSALALGISSLVKRTRAFLPHSLCLLAAAAVTIPFVSNGIGIYLTAVAALFLLSQILSLKTQA